MRGLLLDTHIWFWYLSGSSRLPELVRDLIGRSLEECWVSPISVWELGMLADRGKIHLDRDFRSWLGAALQAMPVKDAVLTREVALWSGEIDLPHRDPADRFLAATALVYGLTLVTVDSHLRKLKSLPTFSG